MAAGTPRAAALLNARPKQREPDIGRTAAAELRRLKRTVARLEKRLAGRTNPKQKRSRYKRDPYDFYREGRAPVQSLLGALELAGKFWDPACGTGNIPRLLIELGHDAVASDVVFRGYAGTQRFDFIDGDLERLPEGAAAAEHLLFNPPYFSARGVIAFARRALALPWTPNIVMVTRQDFLGSQGRHSLFTGALEPTLVLQLSKRPSMPPGRSRVDPNKATGGQMDYVWVIFARRPALRDLVERRFPARFGWIL